MNIVLTFDTEQELRKGFQVLCASSFGFVARHADCTLTKDGVTVRCMLNVSHRTQGIEASLVMNGSDLFKGLSTAWQCRVRERGHLEFGEGVR